MELPIFNTYMNFSRHHFCCFRVVPLFVLNKSTAWNRCQQHPCFKILCKIAQASKNSNSNAQHFLSDLLTHAWFHFMLFALPGYKFPYIVMNRCFYLQSSRECTHLLNYHDERDAVILLLVHLLGAFLFPKLQQRTWSSLSMGDEGRMGAQHNTHTSTRICIPSSFALQSRRPKWSFKEKWKLCIWYKTFI